ncbi:uncharacterized protein A1O9_02332 [Exophiala aquamarina CBS 119918]|uniref:BZIP domain-containing protein n=1 Tax=Exophiala aquamarina CBS 119918 TaxID=1182545 RepID=A0A072PYV8_9EURO|nr:uncharacterized protein A1O9_02332 [Exophiala aquamarina CBS 119918]KEF60770.1 hypothetical protein A1O9_02332 [Exophiala aquamarina CBS 119918]
MPQQPALLGSIDDWTGVTKASDRRKIQNRLNQRLYRKRKRVGVQQSPASTSQATALRAPSLWQIFYSAVEFQRADRAALRIVAEKTPFGAGETERAISEFEKWAQSRSIGSPGTDNLLVLVKFNIFRALVSNCNDLGIPIHDTLVDESVSPFPNPEHPPIDQLRTPAALWPTDLQKQLEHHPWIDLLPIPMMRDNLLQAPEGYDEEALCTDLIGHPNNASTRIGMAIWGEPWDPAGWEVTEGFLQHWGWTIMGCDQLADATNYWRQRRGEQPLNFEGIHTNWTAITAVAPNSARSLHLWS